MTNRPHDDDQLRQVQDALIDLKRQLRDAYEAGDFDEVLRLDQEMIQLAEDYGITVGPGPDPDDL